MMRSRIQISAPYYSELDKKDWMSYLLRPMSIDIDHNKPSVSASPTVQFCTRELDLGYNDQH